MSKIELPETPWESKGGMKGLIQGKQPLSSAFWLFYIIPTVFITFLLLGLNKLGGDSVFFENLYWILPFLLITRSLSWYVVLKNIGNTQLIIFKVITVGIVAIDMMIRALSVVTFILVSS